MKKRPRKSPKADNNDRDRPDRHKPTCAVPVPAGADNETVKLCGEPVISSPSGVACEIHGGGVPWKGDESLMPETSFRLPLNDIPTADDFPDVPERPEFLAPAGATIRVKWGNELHAPVQYNNFHTGEIELTVNLVAGTNVDKAVEAIYKRLEALGQKQFERKLAAFASRYAESQRTGRDL